MAHVDPTDVMGRLTVVETHMSRLPQIEQKVDGLHDDMLELRTLLQVGPRAKEITNPGFRLQEEKKSLLDKIDVDFTDVIKLAILGRGCAPRLETLSIGRDERLRHEYLCPHDASPSSNLPLRRRNIRRRDRSCT